MKKSSGWKRVQTGVYQHASGAVVWRWSRRYVYGVAGGAGRRDTTRSRQETFWASRSKLGFTDKYHDTMKNAIRTALGQ